MPASHSPNNPLYYLEQHPGVVFTVLSDDGNLMDMGRNERFVFVSSNSSESLCEMVGGVHCGTRFPLDNAFLGLVKQVRD